MGIQAMPGMPDMMQEAMDMAFGAVVRDALQPLIVKLTDLEVQIAVLTSQVATVMEAFESVRTGKGMLSRMLNG